ncbi:MAG: hypothetical protein ACK5YI_22355, partial [Rhodospirillales bacterium]
ITVGNNNGNGAPTLVTQATLDKLTAAPRLTIGRGHSTTEETGGILVDGTVAFPIRTRLRSGGIGGWIDLGPGSITVNTSGTDLSGTSEFILEHGIEGWIRQRDDTTVSVNGDMFVIGDVIELLGPAGSMTGTGFFGFGPKQDGGSIGVGAVVAGADVTVTQALIDKTTGFAGVYIGNNTTQSTGIVTFDGTVSFPGRLSVQMAGTGGSVLLTSNAAVTVGATDLSDVFETRLLAGPGGTVTMNAGSSLTTGADVRIQSDDFTALGGTRSGDRLSLGRSSDGGTVYVGSGLSGAVAATSLSATDIDGLLVGFNRLAVGTAGSTGPAVRVGTLTLPAKPLELHGASIAIEQQITGPGRSLTLGAAGTIAIDAPVGGTTDRLSGISVVTATDVSSTAAIYTDLFTQTTGTGTTAFGGPGLFATTGVDITTNRVTGAFTVDALGGTSLTVTSADVTGTFGLSPPTFLP